MAAGVRNLIQAASFVIDPFEIVTMGAYRGITTSNYASPQMFVAPYALMLRGLCFRIDEQWAPSFFPPSVSWTLSFTTPTNTWTLAFALPVTTWTAQ